MTKKCFIVGCGTSIGEIRGFSRIHAHTVISVNGSIILMPWQPPQVYRDDRPWRAWISNDSLCMKWSYWPLVKSALCSHFIRDSWKGKDHGLPLCHYFKARDESVPLQPYDEDNNDSLGEEMKLCGVSSVPSAIDLAIYEGFQDIYLLGVDHYMVDGLSYFWELWPKDKQPTTTMRVSNAFQERMFDSNIAAFKRLNDYAASLGVRIRNCNPESRVEVFPFVEFSEACAI